MKIRAILALALLGSITVPYVSKAAPLWESPVQIYSRAPIVKASCDTRADDKQARCMQACDDTWIKATQAYNANIEEAKVQKKSCEAKCGC